MMRKSQKLLFRRLGQAGFGITEAVIAAAIVIIVAVILSGSLKQSFVSNQRAAATSSCQERVLDVIQVFKNYTDLATVSNWHPTYSGGSVQGTPPNFSLVNLPRNHAFVSVLPSGTPSNILDTDNNNFLLIDNSVNWALELYNSGNFCTNPVTIFSTPLTAGSPTPTPYPLFSNGALRLPPSHLNMRGEKVTLRLQRIDTNTRAVDCNQQGSLTLPPSSSRNLHHYGLLMTVAVSYPRPDTGTGQIGLSPTPPPNSTCQMQIILKQPADNKPATFASVAGTILDPLPATCPITSMGNPVLCACPAFSPFCFTSCSGAGCTNTGTLRMNATQPEYSIICSSAPVTVDVALKSSEPASLFNCRVDYATVAPQITPGNNFVSCANFPLVTPGTAGHIIRSAYPSPSEEKTGVVIRMQNLTAGSYRFATKLIDAGQNVKTQSFVFDVTNGCDPDVQRLYCPPPSPGAPDKCMNPNSCPGTMPLSCDDPTNHICGSSYLDVCGRPGCPLGRGPNAAQCAANLATARCNDPVYDNCGNPCGTFGSQLNPAQCVDTACYNCHVSQSDNCGNVCPGGGAAGDGVCGVAGDVIVGGAVCDGCGVRCGTGTCTNPPFPTPTICEPAGSCSWAPTPAGSCVLPSYVPPSGVPTTTPNPCAQPGLGCAGNCPPTPAACGPGMAWTQGCSIFGWTYGCISVNNLNATYGYCGPGCTGMVCGGVPAPTNSVCSCNSFTATWTCAPMIISPGTPLCHGAPANIGSSGCTCTDTGWNCTVPGNNCISPAPSPPVCPTPQTPLLSCNPITGWRASCGM